MPVDKKRITGPEVTQSPLYFLEDSSGISQLVNKDGTRKDGRGENDIRPIFMKAGVVSQAQGSAYIEIANTKVICAVYGPRQVLRREDFSMTGILKCEFKFATFSCPFRRKFQPDVEEKEFALIIEQALSPAVCLHKFPKSQVDINIRVLENDGSALAASIICSSVALTDAAVEMYDIVTACTLRITPEHMLMDPSYTEETNSINCESNGVVTMGFLPSINQTSSLLQRGHLSCDKVLKALQICTEGCQRIYPLIHECIRRSVKSKYRPAEQDKEKSEEDQNPSKG
ncbi:Exosome complex component MTR3 [Holothuria leucospilota]|uniref:Exosome complex component MTR3 n=1 Tax=Holothuria leucospilota TaxID=206669 RepID=A0A9Q1BAK4_HOLLE|nr:Exosome complex component MTR3 [Holothuria leucospilota]